MDLKEIPREEIQEEISLKIIDKFTHIDDRFYGGNQEWLSSQGFTTKFWADRSCGVVAAANVIYHMSRSRKVSSLYNYPTISKEDFSNHIYDVYQFINPAFYGVPTISEMVRGFTKFTKSRGVIVNPVYLDLSWNLINIVDYIKKGLLDNNPVMMITWNTKIKHLKNHWVTITGYIRTTDDKHYVITSNWGKMEVFNLDVWYSTYSIYKGVIYFEILA